MFLTHKFFFLTGKEKDLKSLHWCYNFRKVKLVLFTNLINCKGNGSRNPGSCVCLNVGCVLRLVMQQNLSVSILKWFSKVTFWTKECHRFLHPIWCSLRLYNKKHVTEDILGQIKTTDRWQDSKSLIFLVKSAQLRESQESTKVLFVPLKSYELYLIKLWVERFHFFAHTNLTFPTHSGCPAMLTLPFSLFERLGILNG